ncbi:hypothetical protein [Mycobacterium ulcerans]|nr:hypothetical protein [Mycobacterium ulcerans]
MWRLISDADPTNCGVILAGPDAATRGTRLAARFPEMPVYASDLGTNITDDSIQVVGLLQSYSLVLDTREGRIQDVWDRAARLIHERKVAGIGPTKSRSPATMP